MAMDGDNGTIDIFYIFLEVLDFRSVLLRKAVPIGVWYVYYGCTGGNDCFDHAREVFSIASRVLLNLYLMWVSDAPMPVWIRGLLAYFRASTAVSISPLTARVRAHTVGVVTNLDISTTLLKSPGLEIGNPASIISTPSV